MELLHPSDVQELDGGVFVHGGTEVVPLLRDGIISTDTLVDVREVVPRGIDGTRIGAGTSLGELEEDPQIPEALREACRLAASPQLRNMGSIGGNLCFADPHSDPATFLLAMDAALEARRGGGRPREIPLAELVSGPYVNTLEAGELLTTVLVPRLEPGAAIVHRKFILHERPAVTVACHLRLDGEGLRNVRLAVGSAGVMVARAPAAEEILEGATAPELHDELERVGGLVADAAKPVKDSNGSVEYKRHLVAVLTLRAVLAAVEEARGEGHELLAPGES